MGAEDGGNAAQRWGEKIINFNLLARVCARAPLPSAIRIRHFVGREKILGRAYIYVALNCSPNVSYARARQLQTQSPTPTCRDINL